VPLDGSFLIQIHARFGSCSKLASQQTIPERRLAEPLAAGNGIFGCRDRMPKSTREIVIVGRDPGTSKIGGKTPAETASFRSTTVSTVREDWMVVCAVTCELVSSRIA
jgi:hypothetical protein